MIPKMYRLYPDLLMPVAKIPDRSTLRVSSRGNGISSCRGHVDESATELFLLLHREHGTGCRRN